MRRLEYISYEEGLGELGMLSLEKALERCYRGLQWGLTRMLERKSLQGVEK